MLTVLSVISGPVVPCATVGNKYLLSLISPSVPGLNTKPKSSVNLVLMISMIMFHAGVIPIFFHSTGQQQEGVRQSTDIASMFTTLLPCDDSFGTGYNCFVCTYSHAIIVYGKLHSSN